MTRTASIDCVSDVVCPGCAPSVTALDQAIGNPAGQVAVELRFKPAEA